MASIFYTIGFHRSGKPRGWLRAVLFRPDGTARPAFQRFVHRKNGTVRQRFSGWVKVPADTGNQRADEEALRPSEVYLLNLKPLEQTVARWRKTKPLPAVLDHAALAQALQVRSAAARRGLILSVSHDHYRKELGGVQLCVQREEVMAPARGVDYLQIHPWQPLPRLAHTDEDPDVAVCLVLNGKDIGVCRMSTLTEVAKDLAGKQGQSLRLVIHQMLGHSPEQLADLAIAACGSQCILWLHDFFSICPSPTLQRNGLSFCNAPAATSNACSLCVSGQERLLHSPRMQDFFQRLAIDVVSPSEHTAQVWQSRSGLTGRSLRVIPHVQLQTKPRATPLAPLPQDAPIRVGHLGSLATHKGWNTYTSLMNDLDRAPNREFVVLGAKRPNQGEDHWQPVTVTSDDPTAMTDAVASQRLDLVLNWPDWPETFSYTTFEALAGSAYVITNAWSGNVAAGVRAAQRGVVLNDPAELVALFRSDRLRDLVARRRADHASTEIHAVHSDLTYHVLEEV